MVPKFPAKPSARRPSPSLAKSGENSLNPIRFGSKRGRIPVAWRESRRRGWIYVEWLQQQSLQQLAITGGLITRPRKKRFREKPVGRRVRRISVDGFVALDHSGLIKAQIAINAGKIGAPRRQILIEEKARPVDGAVVIQFDRPLQIG
jgi:hypothetical protein